MELNYTFPNGGRYITLTIYHRKVEVVPPEKIGRQNLFTFVWFLDNLDT